MQKKYHRITYTHSLQSNPRARQSGMFDDAPKQSHVSSFKHAIYTNYTCSHFVCAPRTRAYRFMLSRAESLARIKRHTHIYISNCVNIYISFSCQESLQNKYIPNVQMHGPRWCTCTNIRLVICLGESIYYTHSATATITPTTTANMVAGRCDEFNRDKIAHVERARSRTQATMYVSPITKHTQLANCILYQCVFCAGAA